MYLQVLHCYTVPPVSHGKHFLSTAEQSFCRSQQARWQLLYLVAKDLHQKPDIQALKTDILQWPVSMHVRLVLMAEAFTNTIWPLGSSYAEDKQKFWIALLTAYDAAVFVQQHFPLENLRLNTEEAKLAVLVRAANFAYSDKYSRDVYEQCSETWAVFLYVIKKGCFPVNLGRDHIRHYFVRSHSSNGYRGSTKDDGGRLYPLLLHATKWTEVRGQVDPIVLSHPYASLRRGTGTDR